MCGTEIDRQQQSLISDQTTAITRKKVYHCTTATAECPSELKHAFHYVGATNNQAPTNTNNVWERELAAGIVNDARERTEIEDGVSVEAYEKEELFDAGEKEGTLIGSA